MCNADFFQKCWHFCLNQNKIRKNDNTFERNEGCTTVFLRWTDFSRFFFENEPKILQHTDIFENKVQWLENHLAPYTFEKKVGNMLPCTIGWVANHDYDMFTRSSNYFRKYWFIRNWQSSKYLISFVWSILIFTKWRKNQK